MRVTVRCEYPGTGLAPTTVSFVPSPVLGATPEEVHETIRRLLSDGEPFELAGVDVGPPLPFAPKTVRQVVVR